MKIRNDFVTNSSSSSFIICFARIANEDKAKAIIEKHTLDVFDCDGVNEENKFVIITDSNEGVEDEWGDAEYDYDFSMNDAINEITEENAFADIEVAEGEGRNG